MDAEYLIICPDRIRDDKPVYWRPFGRGYTKMKKKAGRFTLEQAKRICNEPYVNDYYIEDEKNERRETI